MASTTPSGWRACWKAAGYRRRPTVPGRRRGVQHLRRREAHADSRLYGNLSHLAPHQAPIPTCKSRSVAAWRPKDRDAVLRRAPWVDVVFSAHNIRINARCWSAPGNKGRPGRNRRGAATVPSSLPSSRICLCRVGCHLSGLQQRCTFCISSRRCRVGGRPQPGGHPGRRVPILGDERRVCSKSPCSAETSTPAASRFADALPNRELSPSCCGLQRHRRAGARSVHLHTRPNSTGSDHQRRWRRRATSAPRAARAGPDPTGSCARCGGHRAERYPRHHRARAGGHPACRDYHRSDRPVSRETEEDFAATLGVVRRGPLRVTFATAPSGPGHRPRNSARTAAESRCAGTLNA